MTSKCYADVELIDARLCTRCGAVVVPGYEVKHDLLHDRVETALSQAQGFTPEGEPYGWNA